MRSAPRGSRAASASSATRGPATPTWRPSAFSLTSSTPSTDRQLARSADDGSKTASAYGDVPLRVARDAVLHELAAQVDELEGRLELEHPERQQRGELADAVAGRTQLVAEHARPRAARRAAPRRASAAPAG